MKTLLNLITNLFLALFLGVAISMAIDVPVYIPTGIIFLLGLIPYKREMAFMAGVQKEIWTNHISEHFYAESTFLDYAKDMTEFVEYNTINLAEAGVDPEVVWNNTVFPLEPEQREDAPFAIPLDTATSKPTFVTNVEEIETSYNKMESVVKGHRRAIRNQCLKRAAQAYAPASNGTFTPVLIATGAVRTDTSRRRLTWEDVAKLKKAYTMIEAEGQLVLVLHPHHVEDLKLEDRQFYKEYTDIAAGKVLNREGFIIKEYKNTAIYNDANVKKALGAAPAGTDRYSSLSFMQDEVMKCDGDWKLFYEADTVAYQGDIVNFQKRFKAMPIRNKYIGSIISGT
jgi:hypothetical protein